MDILVDVDDTVANLVGSWIDIYNSDYNDNLKPEMISDWDIGSFTKIGEKFYDYLDDPNLYDKVEPIPGALRVIKQLKSKGYRIIYVTAYDVTNAKLKWLMEHGFTNTKMDYVVAYDKSLINGDILVDDKYNNVKSFSETNHKPAILYNQKWNEKFDWKTRANSWDEVLYWINKFGAKI